MTPAELLPQVYAELRKLAAGKLAGERDDFKELLADLEKPPEAKK